MSKSGEVKILVVGGGGREHALAWRLSKEAEVIVAPGNPGIAEDCETVAVSAKDQDGLVDLCRSRHIDLVVVGPEDPLIEGLGNRLRAEGFAVYGPDQAGAELEGSKAFSKQLMVEAGVPTAAFQAFSDPVAATDYARVKYDTGRSVVVKASGNALGKGVVVADNFEAAKDAIHRMMVDREFGSAGETIVIEDRLVGPEFSLLTIVGDENYVSLPVAQDHKRAFDGDLGPNTGGMGAFSPVASISDSLIRQVESEMVEPTIRALKARGISYRGTLFTGVLVDGGKPYCLEFNVRMGDPETQALMMRIESGYAQALFASATGTVVPEITVSPLAALTVVVAGKDYPLQSSKGIPIQIDQVPIGSKLFHAGTALVDGNLVTNGGRVFAASAIGKTLEEAKALAYAAAASVHFSGARVRSDIGEKSA